MHKHFIVFTILIVFITGCISNYEGEFPQSEKKPVLNALLAADSTFTLRLSWPVDINSTATFEGINNAQVQLWENGASLGFAENMNNGSYQLNTILKSGSTYNVEVSIPGLKTLTASTVIPIAPSFTVSRERTKGEWSDVDHYTLNLGKPSPQVSGVWLYVTELNDDGTLNPAPSMLYSNSSLCDNFNRSYNSTAEGGYSFSYDYFIRIHGSLLSFNQNTLQLASFYAYKSSAFTVITAGTDYDQYFRTAFLQKYWSPKSDIPFTYQPITVYTNVKNGHGIFAGYTVSTVMFN
jgi:hypothetical protein